MKKNPDPRMMQLMLNVNPSMKKAINESKSSNFEVEAEFSLETESGDSIEFVIEGEVTYGDFGIGSYEYWGSKETDTQMGFEVDGYNLKEGSYDPQFEFEINKWMETHQDKIRERLELKAEEQGNQDYDYENEYNADDNLDENIKPKNMKKKLILTEEQFNNVVKQIINEQIEESSLDDYEIGNQKKEALEFKKKAYLAKFMKFRDKFEKEANQLVGNAHGESFGDYKDGEEMGPEKLETEWARYLNDVKDYKNPELYYHTPLKDKKDIYAAALDYPLSEGLNMDSIIGVAVVTLLKLGLKDVDILRLKKYLLQIYPESKRDFKLF